MTRLELIGKLLLAFGEGEFSFSQFARTRDLTGEKLVKGLTTPVLRDEQLITQVRAGRGENIYKLTPKAITAFEKGEEP